MRIRHFCVLTVAIVGAFAWNLPRATAAKIEAKPGKTYLLNKQHGPWMIMVASFGAGLGKGDPEETEQQLTNANKAAHELVLELRRKGIPAYIFTQQGALAEVEAFDRLGNRTQRFEAAQRNRICVVAGNYAGSDDKIAQDTLKYIKGLNPHSLKDGVYKPTPNCPGPLSRAFLTINPLLSEAEIAEQIRERDPLLLKLNSGAEHSIMENKHKFTLVVASFYGNSQLHSHELSSEERSKRSFEFDKKLKQGSSLDKAGEQAWELVKVMRKQGHEAYVFHDRYSSVVTVGGFDSETDPRARELYEKFRAKIDRDQSGKEIIRAEAIQVKGDGQDAKPERNWPMDPQPRLMRVPRLR